MVDVVARRLDDELLALPALKRSRSATLLDHERAVVLGLYAFIALFADLPIYPGDPARLPTYVGEDIVQTTWFLQWTASSLIHGHNPFFTNYLNYPTGVNLAQNTGMPLLGVLTAPLTLTAGPIASMNLLRWLGFTLSAYAAYWVFKHWVRWSPAAFIGGLLYGFSPYMAAQGSVHLNLVFLPLPPLILYALYEVLVAQEHSALRSGVALGLLSAAQYYISSEVLATTALIAGIAGFYLFFLGFSSIRGRLHHGLIGLGVAALVLAPLIVYPLYLMIAGPNHYSGPAQGFHNVYNADLLGPILPSSAVLVAPHRLVTLGSSLVGNNPQENGSYLGIPLLLLATAAVCRYWRRLWPLFCGLMVLTSFVLSLGPVLVLDGKIRNLPVDLPWRKIDRLPLIENILPVRLSLYVVFFVAVILAIGLDAYHDDLLERRARGANRTRRVRAGRLLGGVLALGALISLIPRWPYPSFSSSLRSAVSPAGLQKIPNGAVVLTYPYPTSFTDQAMLWQAMDGMRWHLLGGYALTPNPVGASTVFPGILQPKAIEAMLVNSVTPVPDPDLPNLVATSTTITASRVVVLAPGRPLVGGPQPTAVVFVNSVDAKHHLLYVYRNHFFPISVTVSRTTAYATTVRHSGPLALGLIVPGERLALFGTSGVGTVNTTTTRLLRGFLRQNHVTAVLVGLGITDAWEVGLWLRAAIGPPTRAGGGGELWTNVPARLQATDTFLS